MDEVMSRILEAVSPTPQPLPLLKELQEREGGESEEDKPVKKQ
jgi:hypothetical protein